MKEEYQLHFLCDTSISDLSFEIVAVPFSEVCVAVLVSTIQYTGTELFCTTQMLDMIRDDNIG